jgi:hypothetical protein
MPLVTVWSSRLRHVIAKLGPSELGQLLSTQFLSSGFRLDRSGRPRDRALSLLFERSWSKQKDQDFLGKIG